MDRRTLYGGVVALVGVVLAVVQVIHALQQSANPVFVAVDAVPMVGVALALAFAGTRLADEVAEPDLGRVLGWTVGGTVVFLSFAALALFSRNVATGDLSRAAFVAVDNLTVGATAGILVGLYDARGQERLRRLRAERDRVEAFADKAADLNNYGRAIARADDPEGVAAFCIEAVSTLLGVEATAVVEVSDDGVRVVGSTLVGVGDEAVRALAELARDQDVGTVAVHDGAPVEVGRAVGTTVTVHVADRDGSSFVMASLADADSEVGPEDRELLELLVSHAAMALGSIDARARAD